MEIAFFLFVAWAFITVLGHTSWVIVSTIFRAIFRIGDSPSGNHIPGIEFNRRDDIEATRRTLRRLRNENRLPQKQISEILYTLRESELDYQSGVSPQPTPASDASIPNAEPSTPIAAGTPKKAALKTDDLDATSNAGTTSSDLETVALETVAPETVTPETVTPETVESKSAAHATSGAANTDQHDAEPVPAILVESGSSSLCDPSLQNSPNTIPAAADQHAIRGRDAGLEAAGRRSEASSPASVAAQTPRPPSISRSQIIQSFLSAHNIRWGELVAGMLIVGCSIGLVISRWSSLVQTHRVIPSLIFLGANAAIFAAGLYTLSKWRLRHTSRAVLVIATLLVPLSVLAGLAAAGTKPDAVHLSDPITLAALAIGGVIYTGLLYFGSTALTRKTYAWPMVAAVAGPVATLPLMPAAVRRFDASAGWIVALASISVLLAASWIHRLRRASTASFFSSEETPALAGSIGPAGSRLRLLVVAFGAFSLTVATAFAAFYLSKYESGAYLPLTIVLIPAVLGLAATSRSLMTDARSHVVSMAGAFGVCGFIGLALIALPSVLVSEGWLWTWAISLAGSGVLVGQLFRQPRWLAASTVPVGIAALLTSQVWLGGIAWEINPWWSRLICGESMLAALAMTMFSATLAWILRSEVQQRWMVFAAAGWGGATLLIAAVLAVAPMSLLGVVPAWIVSTVLVGATVAAFVLSMRTEYAGYAAIVALVFSWLSVLRPDAWLSADALTNWMLLSTGVAACLLLMSELSRVWMQRFANPGDRDVAVRSCVRWVTVACCFVVVASVAAVLDAAGLDAAGLDFEPDRWAPVTILAISTVLLIWASSIRRSADMLRAAQFMSLLLAGVVGYIWFRPTMLRLDSWETGAAGWSWCIALGGVALFWLLVRESASWLLRPNALMSTAGSVSDNEQSPSKLASRLQHVCGVESRLQRMLDGWTAAAAVALALLLALYFFVTLCIGVSTDSMQLYVPTWGLPLVALPLVGITALGVKRQEPDGEPFDWLLPVVSVAAVVWTACQFATQLPLQASGVLIVATTLATVALGLAAYWCDHSWDGRPGRIATRTYVASTSLVIGVASCSLLYGGWLLPILDGQLADRMSTLAVSSWLIITSIGLVWRAYRMPQPISAAVSVVLWSAAASLILPAFTRTPPTVWVQAAAVAAVLWVLIVRVWVDPETRSRMRPTVIGVLQVMVLIGVATSILVTAGIVLNLDALHAIMGPIGCALSTITTIGLCSRRTRVGLLDGDPLPWHVSWPVGISLLAGQFGWVAYMLGWVGGVGAIETVAVVWGVTSIAALWTSRQRESLFDLAHVAGVAVATVVLAIELGFRSDLMRWIALLGLVAAGIQVAQLAMRAANKAALTANGTTRTASRSAFSSDKTWILALNRLVGWWVGAAGGVLLLMKFADRAVGSQSWAMLVLWFVVWVLVWRWTSRESAVDRDGRKRLQYAIPDLEFSGLLLAGVIFETIFFVYEGRDSIVVGLSGDSWLWIRLACYAASAASVFWRASSRTAWTIAVATSVGLAALISVQASIELDATRTQRIAWAVLACGFTIAFAAHWLPGISRMLSRLTRVNPDRYFGGLVQATWFNAAIIALLGAGLSILMMILGAPAAEIQITIATVALSAWAMAEMADEGNLDRLRHSSVIVGLSAVGLWASVDNGATGHPFLAGSMRWLVASVLLIPTLVFLVPKLFGDVGYLRWKNAFTLGIRIAVAAAIGSLATMLTLEFILRDSSGIEGLPLAIVISVLLTLGVLSALAGIVAIASGPNSPLRDRLQLHDVQRTTLIIAAQAIGVLAWLHLYLCQPDWAFVGLRGYWPYVVMALAFATVAVTEWAQRSGDIVMSRTLKQTALYLPLIPVLGFWLSGSFHRLNWAFAGGQVRYDVLLAIGTIYYIGIAAMWKGVMPRVTAIVLGNAAWWVMLTQWPGWGFLAHPQLWIIPPVVCVLVLTHVYRERLEPHVLSAIRYAATLVIYVSSTADMLIQDIGSTLFGPVILILLALFGMLLGVILRVRPFLYLGATFVFLGVTSMVWHAQERFDSVWPWWVFGITTGLCLLIGLMALEKFKPQLRQYANELARWEA